MTRCHLLADSLRGLGDLDPDVQAVALQDAAQILDLLAEAQTEAGADACDAS